MVASEWIEYRGVRARVIIEDADALPEQYVMASVEVEGERIAQRRTDGEPYGPLYTAHLRATPKEAPSDKT